MLYYLKHIIFIAIEIILLGLFVLSNQIGINHDFRITLFFAFVFALFIHIYIFITMDCKKSIKK